MSFLVALFEGKYASKRSAGVFLACDIMSITDDELIAGAGGLFSYATFYVSIKYLTKVKTIAE